MKNFAIATLMFAGLIMAGSEGPYFPLPNLAGGIIIIIAFVAMNRKERNHGHLH